MTASPFKFLDSFDRGDRSIYFGRDSEIEQLYRLLFEARLVLVYGQSGAGKTSLIRCGLANRFADTDWFELFVRRNDDLNTSLVREIRAQAATRIPDDRPPVEAIRSLYLDHLRPVYLIFDQFEELFVLGSKDEQHQFFATVAAILASDVSCRIIVSLREEYLGSLYPFEPAVPSLFNKRLRVEQMSMTNIEEVITGMTGALKIALEHGAGTAQKIVAQLDDGRSGVQLAYLQVYLDTLYQRAATRGEPVTFTDHDIEETGKLGDLMAGYLQTQKTQIENDLHASHPGLARDSIQHLLELFVTADGTKHPTTRADVLARMPGSAPWLDQALAALENARILRAGDDTIELAHDSLAKRIADSRSADRVAMLNVERLVGDALFRHQQDRSAYLNARDLQTVRRAQKLSAAGVATLELSRDERDFLRKSRIRVWRRRAVLGVALVALIAVPLVVGALAAWSDADDQTVAATNDSDWILYRTYDSLVGYPDLEQARLDLLRAERDINSRREAESLFSDEDDHFWGDLYAADVKVDRSIRDGHADPAAVRSAYGPLLHEWTIRNRDDPTDLRARVRLKAVLWREEEWADDAKAPGFLNRILEATAPQKGDASAISFQQDIEDACSTLTSFNLRNGRCPSGP